MRYSSYALIVVICHYFYHLIRNTFVLSDIMTTITLNIILYEVFFWVPALIFEWMDRDGISKEFKRRFKLPEIPSKVKFWDTVISSILNQICQHIVISILMYLVLTKFYESFTSTIFWILVSNSESCSKRRREFWIIIRGLLVFIMIHLFGK
jgi:hypothetical protein